MIWTKEESTFLIDLSIYALEADVDKTCNKGKIKIVTGSGSGECQSVSHSHLGIIISELS